MTKAEAAIAFQRLLLAYGAIYAPRNPKHLDYSEPGNVFTRDLIDSVPVLLETGYVIPKPPLSDDLIKQLNRTSWAEYD